MIESAANPTTAVGRTPTLGELVRDADLERSLAKLLAPGVDGLAVFSADGAPFTSATSESSPLRRWAQLPAEATHALRTGEPGFGLEGHRFDVRPLYAGAERVALPTGAHESVGTVQLHCPIRGFIGRGVDDIDVQPGVGVRPHDFRHGAREFERLRRVELGREGMMRLNLARHDR